MKVLAALDFLLAALLLSGALAAFVFIPSTVERFSIEPEDFYLALILGFLCVAVAAILTLTGLALLGRMVRHKRAIFNLSIAATGVLFLLSVADAALSLLSPVPNPDFMLLILPTFVLGVSSIGLHKLDSVRPS